MWREATDRRARLARSGGVRFKAAVLALALAAGCTMSPPADRESRAFDAADAQLRAVERFQSLKRSCRASGGVIYVRRTSPGRLPPTAGELNAARCVPAGFR